MVDTVKHLPKDNLEAITLLQLAIPRSLATSRHLSSLLSHLTKVLAAATLHTGRARHHMDMEPPRRKLVDQAIRPMDRRDRHHNVVTKVTSLARISLLGVFSAFSPFTFLPF